MKKIPMYKLTLRWNSPIREAKIGHMTNLMGSNSSVVSNFVKIIFIRLAPGCFQTKVTTTKAFIWQQIVVMLEQV